MTSLQADRPAAGRAVYGVRTCVVQSSQPSCPPWMQTCMSSVRRWASARGYEYVHVGDAEFLGAVPRWYRDKAAGVMQPVADLARVELAIRHITSADVVAWIDADVLVFDEERFGLPSIGGIAFTREIWLDVKRPTGTPYCVERVNNSVMVASDPGSLEQYRQTCLRIAAASRGGLPKSAVSTTYLTVLDRTQPIAAVRHVGNFSPPVLRAVAQGTQGILGVYRESLGEPLFAANLCASFENRDYFGMVSSSAEYEQTVDLLLATRGSVLNNPNQPSRSGSPVSPRPQREGLPDACSTGDPR